MTPSVQGSSTSPWPVRLGLLTVYRFLQPRARPQHFAMAGCSPGYRPMSEQLISRSSIPSTNRSNSRKNTKGR